MSTLTAQSYIEKSVSLLKANPAGTTVGVTYTHSKTERKRPLVRFRTYNDHLGVCLTYRTHKTKEFSRILNAVGPHGMTAGEEEVEGFAGVMANVDFQQIAREKARLEEEKKKETAEQPQAKEAGHKKSKKKKKKKGRKH